MQFVSKYLFVLTATLILAACSSHRSFESDMQVEDAPDWVNGQELVKSGERGKVIRAVGQASPLGNISLQKTTAANRARAELARELSVAVDSAQQNFTFAIEGEKEARSDISSENKFNTNVLMAGSRIAAYWKNEKTGDIYALAELEMSQVKTNLERSKNMNKAFKKYLQQNPDALINPKGN